ncbi:MAG: IS481 family transposase [bacterium]
MPWKETGAMDERLQFVGLSLTGEYSVAVLCREFGISRKTGSKWLGRYQAEGVEGLAEQSRAPHHQARAVSATIERRIVQLRSERPRHGPKKLRRLLELQDPEINWPAVSTIGELLKRHGLVVPRRRSRKTPPYEQPLAGCDQANAVWSADFKGWFMTGDRQRCDPLTISDNYSRYLLRCQLVRPVNYETIKPVFVAAFQEFGLPQAIRTDNGVPFATTTVGGLSRLSIWWLRLGILPERIEPGKPQQNPRHERMHRTLKDYTATPPQSTWRRQQAAFDRFREEYNQERPHESLGQCFPADLYQPSPRPYPLLLPQMNYPDDMQLRSVKSQGDISWKGRHVYLSETLAGELVGLRQIAEDRWDIYCGPIRLAQLETLTPKLIHLKRSKPRKLNQADQRNQHSKKCYLCDRSKL